MDPIGRFADDSGVEVLLIAETSDLMDMYRLKLELDGYRVTTVTRLQDWKTPKPGWRPDMAMIDITSGDAATLSEARSLGAHPLLKDVPLLLLSTESIDELRRQRLALRPIDYVLRVATADLSPTVEQWSQEAVNSLCR